MTCTLVIGGVDYSSSSSYIYHNEVEVLEFVIGRLKWNLKDKYPYHSSIYYTALVSLGDKVLVFGGNDSSSGAVSTIAQYSNDNWTKIGDLLQPRYAHNCIVFESDILIVGGSGTLSTEAWNIENKSSTAIEPTLSNYRYYPALLHVPFEFCLPNLRLSENNII